MKDDKTIYFFNFNYLPIKKQNILLLNDSLAGRVLNWEAFPCPSTPSRYVHPFRNFTFSFTDTEKII